MSEQISPDTSRHFPKVALFVILGFLLVSLVWAMRFSESPVRLIPADQVTNQGRTTAIPSSPVSPVSQENAWQLEPNTLSGGWQRVYPNYWGELRALATAGPSVYAVGTEAVLVHQNSESERAWQSVRPAWGDYWDVGLVSAEEGWLIGKSGQLLHFKGNAQERVETPTKDHLWDIQVVAPDNAWIVGENGLVLRFDGRSWIQVTVPTTRTIYALNFITDDEAWAVGRDGLILHVLNGQWSIVTSPTQHHLRGLAMVSASEGWAVGASGTILHFDGQTWKSTPSPTAQDLRSVSSPMSGMAWAVGAAGTILRYADAKWSEWPTSAWLWKEQGVGYFGEGDQKDDLLVFRKADLWRISMLTPNEGWILGNNTLAHYTHGEWRSVFAPEIIGTVDFAPDGTGWAMGRGPALHFLNGEWQTFECPTDRSLSDCGRAMLVSDDELQPVESVGFQVEHLDVLKRSDAWATGASNKVYHFDGATWRRSKLPTRVWNIQMLASDDGWIVGSDGYTAHYDGRTWTKVDTPTDRDLYAISMVSPNEGWAAGAKGIFLHYWQGQWQVEPSPIGKNIVLLSMASAQEGWAVTGLNEDGKLLHFQNGVWQAIDAPTREKITALKMVSDSDGWLLTGRGIIYRYRQGRWTIFVQLPDTHFTRDLAVLPSGEIWIVGNSGEIWHYTPSSP